MEVYFFDFVDSTGARQSDGMTSDGLVKRTHFKAATLSGAKKVRELHKRMGHPSDTAFGNALNHGVYI